MAHSQDEPRLSEACDSESVVEVEVLNEHEYRAVVEQQQQSARQDQMVRERARAIIRQYKAGFSPNLLQNYNLMHFDAILASKVIIRLLQLSLAEDDRCSRGGQRSAYLQSRNLAIAQQSGKLLHQLGGIALMSIVLHEWIPAFDQHDLSAAWTDIGLWQHPKTISSQEKLP